MMDFGEAFGVKAEGFVGRRVESLDKRGDRSKIRLLLSLKFSELRYS
jgi:hypothetical protein